MKSRDVLTNVRSAQVEDFTSVVTMSRDGNIGKMVDTMQIRIYSKLLSFVSIYFETAKIHKS